MDERADLPGMLLSAAAGLLEEASTLAASAETATDVIQMGVLERTVADAATLISAAKVLVIGESRALD